MTCGVYAPVLLPLLSSNSIPSSHYVYYSMVPPHPTLPSPGLAKLSPGQQELD